MIIPRSIKNRIDINMRFQVYQCRRCGNIQLSSSKRIFKCIICNRSTKILSKKSIGTHLKILYSTNDAYEAPFMVRELKKLKHEGKLF